MKTKKGKARLRSGTGDRINRQGCENSYYKHSPCVQEGRGKHKYIRKIESIKMTQIELLETENTTSEF